MFDFKINLPLEKRLYISMNEILLQVDDKKRIISLENDFVTTTKLGIYIVLKKTLYIDQE